MGTPQITYKVTILSLAVLNLFLSALFLLWSNSLIRVNQVLKKWISTEKIEKALNSVRDIDSQLMNMRKIIGFVCVILAITFIFLYLRY